MASQNERLLMRSFSCWTQASQRLGREAEFIAGWLLREVPEKNGTIDHRSPLLAGLWKRLYAARARKSSETSNRTPGTQAVSQQHNIKSIAYEHINSRKE